MKTWTYIFQIFATLSLVFSDYISSFLLRSRHFLSRSVSALIAKVSLDLFGRKGLKMAKYSQAGHAGCDWKNFSQDCFGRKPIGWVWSPHLFGRADCAFSALVGHESLELAEIGRSGWVTAYWVAPFPESSRLHLGREVRGLTPVFMVAKA